MGALHDTTSINLHSIIDSVCDGCRQGVGNRGRNSNENPSPLDRLCFVLLRRSKHIQELHLSFPWDRPEHKLFALSSCPITLQSCAMAGGRPGSAGKSTMGSSSA